MDPRSKRSTSLVKLYWRVIYHNAFLLLIMRPILRLNAICLKQQFRLIGKTKLIGDLDFIGNCEEFSQLLRKIDSIMHEDIFIKNKFVFIQYNDAPFKNVMFGEYAVPARYQKPKASGVGALMIYGFYLTEFFGRTLGSNVRIYRQPGSRIPKDKTYLWLTEHHFPDEISEWFNQNKATNTEK